MKVNIPKTEKTLRKERLEANKKNTKEPTNSELKEILFDILEEIKDIKKDS